MPIRFSEHGPSFPDALVDDMLEGKVVFLCGAGVSSPQLPGFKALAEQVYNDLGAEMSVAETEAAGSGRFEEVLGSLSRRMADPRAVQDAVEDRLKLEAPDLSHHSTLLRLSRDLVGRPCLVTTNFDTLFERAYETANGNGSSQALSLAGEALPPPGANEFFGVMHLHGRLRDKVLGLAPSPLVLTSAQYGDAYMRSAWASRFLFDLARCRTIVLVGYGAEDAPVRYFLNVLEADRARFEDVQDVYALDGDAVSSLNSGGRWDAVAVKALMFRKAATGDPYKPLWDDLAALAELVDRPRVWRETRAKVIFSEPFDAADQAAIDVIDWLFRGKRDLRDVAILSIRDPRWFDHLFAQKLFHDREDAWVPAAWCGLDWNDRGRLDNAVGWLERLGKEFATGLDQRLAARGPEDHLTYRAWRALATSSRIDFDPGVKAYRLKTRVRDPRRSDRDLRDAVRLLTPSVVAEPRWRVAEATDGPPQGLRDLLRFRLEVRDRGGLKELSDALLEHADPSRLVQIATESLRISIEAAHEVELILPPFDRLDDAIPTVEPHAQNKYRNGVVFLVQLLTAAYGLLAPSDVELARATAEVWRGLDSRIGRRLHLQALRRKDVFSADEAAKAVLNLSKDDFWSIRRELILAMAERLKDASDSQIDAITQRVLLEGPSLYEEIGEPEPGQTDWRPLVRDRDTWLRLTALKRAKRLNAEGRAALAEIQARNSGLDRDFSEVDLFGSYSEGVTRVTGDPEPLRKATDPKQRLEVAKTLSTTWDPDARYSWSAYCSVDPDGALEALRAAPLNLENAALWRSLLTALIAGLQDHPSRRKAREGVTLAIFAHLDGATDDFINEVAGELVDLLPRARKLRLIAADAWWDRLWVALERTTDEEIDVESGDRFYDIVINRPAGRLAEDLLTVISSRKTASQKISKENRARLKQICESDTIAGWFGRGAVVREAGFLHFVDPRGVKRQLKPWLLRDDLQGKTLRTILVEWASLGDKVTITLKEPILRGVQESQASGVAATHVASRILAPLFRAAFATDASTPPITEAEARAILKKAAPSVLEGAADCFATWVSDSSRKPENAWRKAISPIFRAVWPRERTYLRSLYTPELAKLCVGAGARFPEALAMIGHYLMPFEDTWSSLHFLTSATAPDKQPAATLDLLWRLCGPPFEGQAHSLREILDRVAVASPELELDRRFQWLQQRAPRFD